MTALLDPVRLDRFERVMVSVLNEATGKQASWSMGQGVYTSTFAGDFLSLSVDGPIFPATTGGRAFVIQPCESVAFTVDAVVTGQLLGLVVNDVPFRVQVAADDTVDTIRDTLVAAVTADAGGEFTGTAGVGAGTWTLAPTSFGSIWSARSFGSMTGTVTLEDEFASVTQGWAQFSMTVEAFSKSRTPRGGAMALATKCMTALQMPAYALTLRDYGVGIGTISPPVDLSAIAGGNWESRVAFDVVCNLTFSVSSAVGRIATVDVSAALTKPSLSYTIEATS